MYGKVLIVDTIATNRIVLKVKLSAAYYDVSQANSIAEAMRAVKQSRPDVIISATALPDGTITDLAQGLRAEEVGRNLPIIAMDSDGISTTRHKLLEAGVDDVMAKPVDDTLLLARLRSLVRAYSSSSEWEMRDDTSRALGFSDPEIAVTTQSKVVLISATPAKSVRWLAHLRPILKAQLSLAHPNSAMTPQGLSESDGQPDVYVLIFDEGHPDEMLRLLTAIRAHPSSRHSGILVVQSETNPRIGAQALDLGANDIMCHGFSAEEMALRIRTLVRRKKIGERLRATVRTGIQAAICDPLTGLHNRRYAMPHLDRILEHATKTNKTFAVMVADMDHFKRINDIYGHAAGDAVLVETAQRMRENLRAVDLVARIGGEEFLIVLPGVQLPNARNAARRLCQLIGNRPFDLPGNAGQLNATISVGLAIGGPGTLDAAGGLTGAQFLMDRADKALFHAKTSGRNQVMLSRPAA